MNPNTAPSTMSGSLSVKRSGLAAREWGTLLLVALPIVVLAAALVVDKFKAAAAKSQLRSIIAQLREEGIPVDNAAIVRQYDAETSQDQTLPWASLLQSSSPFQDDPSHGLDSSRDYAMVSPTADSPLDSIAHEGQLDLNVLDFITTRDRPLIQARSALLNSAADDAKRPVWLPLGAGGGLRWNPSFSSTFVMQDIRAFQSDIGHGRNDDAISALQRMHDTVNQLEPNARFDSVSQAAPIEIHKMIRASLAVADWDTDQLKQLREMVESKPDYAQTHRQALERAIATSLDNLGAESENPMTAHLGRNESFRVEIPPQTVLQWLGYMQKVETEGQPGTLAMLTDNQWHWDYYPRSSQAEALTLTTFPLATGTAMMSQAGAETSSFLSGYARYETSRRWTLTALAIKQYKQQHNKWPAELSELAKVGLNRSDWRVMPNVPFGYQAKPLASDSKINEVVLWTPELGYGNTRDQVIEYSKSSESQEPPREHILSAEYAMSQIALIRETGK